MKEKIDIIFVYWDTDIFIKKCISQFLKTKFDNYNIYIVDNTLSSEKKIKSYFNSKKVNVIPGIDLMTCCMDSGVHHQWGVQKGIDNTDSEYIFVCHCDSWPIDRNWAEKLFEYLNIDKVNLVGLQQESSLHSSLHFLKRKTLIDFDNKLTKGKLSFGKNKSRTELEKYVRYPEAVRLSRGKWDWGEDLAIRMYSKNKYTFGLNPIKGFAPDGEFKNEKYGTVASCWRHLGQDGYGCVYGEDLFFHVWKTYGKGKKVSRYLKMYKNDEYLKRYYYCDQSYEKVVINKGIHDNTYYKICDDFKYRRL